MGYIREFGRMIKWLGPPKVKPNPKKIYSDSYTSDGENDIVKDLIITVSGLLYLFCGYTFLMLMLFGLYHFGKLLFNFC